MSLTVMYVPAVRSSHPKPLWSAIWWRPPPSHDASGAELSSPAHTLIKKNSSYESKGFTTRASPSLPPCGETTATQASCFTPGLVPQELQARCHLTPRPARSLIFKLENPLDYPMPPDPWRPCLSRKSMWQRGKKLLQDSGSPAVQTGIS